MKQKESVNPIQSKVQQTFYQDGLMEVMIGVYLLVMGAMMQGGAGYFAALAIFVMVPAWRAAKRRYVFPRIGYVNLEKEEETKKEVKGILWFTLGYMVFLAAAVLVSTRIWGPDQGRDFFFMRLLPVTVGLALAIGPYTLAVKTQLKRWYAFSALFALVGVGVTFIKFDDFLDLIAAQLFISSLVPLLVGLATFVRFLRKNPVIEEGDNGEG